MRRPTRYFLAERYLLQENLFCNLRPPFETGTVILATPFLELAIANIFDA